MSHISHTGQRVIKSLDARSNDVTQLTSMTFMTHVPSMTPMTFLPFNIPRE